MSIIRDDDEPLWVAILGISVLIIAVVAWVLGK